MKSIGRYSYKKCSHAYRSPLPSSGVWGRAMASGAGVTQAVANDGVKINSAWSLATLITGRSMFSPSQYLPKRTVIMGQMEARNECIHSYREFRVVCIYGVSVN